MNRRWNLAAALAILTTSVLLAAHWPVFPWFLDYFYHLGVVEGFRQSGGLTLHDWWEFAPGGRPHLYPPLWHLVGLALVKLGIPLMTLARLWCVLLYPIFALILWRILRKLWDTPAATWATVLVAISLPLTTALVNYPAATLAVLFGLVAWVSIERGRMLAASLALGLAGYTHTATFWTFALTLLVYLLIRKETRRANLIALAGGLLVAAPWTIHQLLHAGAVHLGIRKESEFLELAPVLLALAGWGALRVLRQSLPPTRSGAHHERKPLPFALSLPKGNGPKKSSFFNPPPKSAGPI